MDGIAFRRVETTHAFHTGMMKPLCESVTSLASAVTLHAPKIPYISNVTGSWITAEEATDPTYWARHMCQTARFADGVQVLLQEREQLLLEVGAGQSLGSFVRQHPDCGRERMNQIFSTLPARGEQRPALAALLTTLSHLWLAGVTIDWRGFYRDEQRRRVALPTYPFQRQRHWIDAPAKNAQKAAVSPQAARAASGKKADIADWFYLPDWKQAPLPAGISLPDGEAAAPYLLFADTTGLSDQLAQQLRAAHYRVVIVRSEIMVR
jgi:acyl transferase domain-containing protein